MLHAGVPVVALERLGERRERRAQLADLAAPVHRQLDALALGMQRLHVVLQRAGARGGVAEARGQRGDVGFRGLHGRRHGVDSGVRRAQAGAHVGAKRLQPARAVRAPLVERVQRRAHVRRRRHRGGAWRGETASR